MRSAVTLNTATWTTILLSLAAEPFSPINAWLSQGTPIHLEEYHRHVGNKHTPERKSTTFFEQTSSFHRSSTVKSNLTVLTSDTLRLSIAPFKVLMAYGNTKTENYSIALKRKSSDTVSLSPRGQQSHNIR